MKDYPSSSYQQLAERTENEFNAAYNYCKGLGLKEADIRKLKEQKDALNLGIKQVKNIKTLNFNEFGFYDGQEKILRNVVKSLKDLIKTEERKK